MGERTSLPGAIYIDCSVWCGLCGYEQSLEASGKREAAKLARQAGWHYTRAGGWVCPQCWGKCHKAAEGG